MASVVCYKAATETFFSRLNSCSQQFRLQASIVATGSSPPSAVRFRASKS